ncbi:MAG TPA: thiol:disulfide interchange protein DsbA/DsbL [Rudaea sp.]|nr:thiol:disulfide interchange protein DsbA/DsbL [Rudaea sp.]
MLKHLAILLTGLVAVSACSANTSPPPASSPPVAKHNWVEGKDYHLITPPQPTSGDKVVVTEVFSYACPHCAHFQPYADELKSKLPAGVEFKLLPAVFNSQWEPFARAFYTAKSMGILGKTHQALFDALHRDHLPLRSIEDLANLFYSNYGVNPGEFLSTASSFVIDGELANGNKQVHDYQVDATPTLVVDGKYRVTADASRGDGFPEMVQVALDLVQRELDARKPHPAGH